MAQGRGNEELLDTALATLKASRALLLELQAEQVTLVAKIEQAEQKVAEAAVAAQRAEALLHHSELGPFIKASEGGVGRDSVD